jgi:outer membrane protein assembly factor BamE (lipoprotein component of BamABCDE complex)
MLIQMNIKNFITYFLILILANSCTLSPSITHSGVINLEQKKDVFFLGKTNKNDVIKAIGETLLKEYPEEKSWIYIETETKRNLLGKKILIKNDILMLGFDDKGILLTKDFYNLKSMKDLNFNEEITQTTAIEESNSKKFFSSMRKRLRTLSDKKVE